MRRSAGAAGRTPCRPDARCRCGPGRKTTSLERRHPCPGHPLGRNMSDRTPAGLLARGSGRGARPSQASPVSASGPVAAPPVVRGHDTRHARRLQLQGQPRHRATSARTAFPRWLLGEAPARSWRPRGTGSWPALQPHARLGNDDGIAVRHKRARAAPPRAAPRPRSRGRPAPARSRPIRWTPSRSRRRSPAPPATGRARWPC